MTERYPIVYNSRVMEAGHHFPELVRAWIKDCLFRAILKIFVGGFFLHLPFI